LYQIDEDQLSEAMNFNLALDRSEVLLCDVLRPGVNLKGGVFGTNLEVGGCGICVYRCLPEV
jgi:hypothetical protein